MLTHLHIPISFAICLINCIYLGGAAYFSARIFAPVVKPLYLLIFIILNWIIIKLAVLPLSEMQFLFFTMGACWYFQKYCLSKKTGPLILSAVFCMMGIFTRTAGVALLAALLISFLLVIRRQIVEWIRGPRIVFIIGLVILVSALTGLFISRAFLDYIAFFTNPFKSDPLSFIVTNIQRHMVDWAEIFINIPFSKTGKYLPEQIARIVYIILGIFFLILLIRLLFNKNTTVSIIAKVYLPIYLLLIFSWPYFEARFWAPILPLVGGIVLQYKTIATPLFKKLFSAYAFYYLLAGLIALGFYTQLSFNKRELSQKQEEGQFRHEYEKHFFGINSPDSLIEQKAMYMLDKYDR